MTPQSRPVSSPLYSPGLQSKMPPQQGFFTERSIIIASLAEGRELHQIASRSFQVLGSTIHLKEPFMRYIDDYQYTKDLTLD